MTYDTTRLHQTYNQIIAQPIILNPAGLRKKSGQKTQQIGRNDPECNYPGTKQPARNIQYSVYDKYYIFLKRI